MSDDRGSGRWLWMGSGWEVDGRYPRGTTPPLWLSPQGQHLCMLQKYLKVDKNPMKIPLAVGNLVQQCTAYSDLVVH